jgi:hypothetical protein
MPSRSEAEELFRDLGFDSLPKMLREQPLTANARAAAAIAVEHQFKKQQDKIISEAPPGVKRELSAQRQNGIQSPKLSKLDAQKSKLLELLNDPSLEEKITAMSEPFKNGSFKQTQDAHQSPNDAWVSEQYNLWKSSWERYFLNSPYAASDGYVIQMRPEDNAPLYIFRLLLVAMSGNPKEFDPVALENAVQMKDLKFENPNDMDNFVQAVKKQFKGDVDPIMSRHGPNQCIGFAVKNDDVRQNFLDWAEQRGNKLDPVVDEPEDPADQPGLNN